MAKTVKYIGTLTRWPELATTGKQSVWLPGQQEERSDAEAALLMATTLFIGVLGHAYVNYAGQIVDKNGALVDGGGNKAPLQNPAYFAVLNNTLGGDANAANNGATAITTRQNGLQSCKVVRRATRFRLRFSNGMPGTPGTAFTLSATVQVPSKNGSGVQNLTVTFNNGQSSYAVPAGGGVVFYSDWITWPCAAGDMFYIKTDCYNGGSAFSIPSFGSPYSIVAGCAAGDWDSSVSNAADNSALTVAKGSGVWASSTYTANLYKCLQVETDSIESATLPSVDLWGDSIAYSQNSNGSLSFLVQVMFAAGVAFQNYGIPGSNQTQIPSRANTRMQLAKGDIAICEHGRNATGNTAELRALWTFLRGLGAKKIIQTTTTDYIGLAAGTLGESSAAMRAYQASQVGTADGPDVLWDCRSFLQQQVDSSLTVGTISVSSGTAAVVGVGTNFTDALCGSLLTTAAGVTIGSVLTVTDANNLVLTANVSSTVTAQAFVAQQWKYTQQGAAVTISTTKGGTAVSFGGTTGYTAALAGLYIVAADGGVIGKISNSTTLTAVANRTYSGSIGLSWSLDGLHPGVLGDNSSAALMIAAGYQNDLLKY